MRNLPGDCKRWLGKLHGISWNLAETRGLPSGPLQFAGVLNRRIAVEPGMVGTDFPSRREAGRG